MTPLPHKPVPEPSKGWWHRFRTPKDILIDESITSLTNERRDNHITHAHVGDEVTILGMVTAISLPPTSTNRDGTVSRPEAVLTVDAGPLNVGFRFDRDDANLLLGKIVEISGTLTTDPFGSHAYIVDNPVMEALPVHFNV